ncbi:MAG: hypothetical protein ACXVCP_19875 [Bdellovibrio sp.]
MTLPLICWTILISLLAIESNGSVQSFSLKTKDSSALINGEVDIPASCENRKCPAILMVGGTGLFDRDYDFGNSNTDNDLLFKKLSERINDKGIIVIRYDYRGVKCSIKTAPKCTTCQTSADYFKSYYNNCIDPTVRSKVTPETIRQDIITVYDFIKSLSYVSQITVLAHSEGTIHVARLIHDRDIVPNSLLMLGMVAESPIGVIHWQMVDRTVDSIFKFDRNKNGLIDKDERQLYCSENKLTQDQCDQIIPSVELLDRATITLNIENGYQVGLKVILTTPDSTPFLNPQAPMASFAWWKMWFTDTNNSVDELLGYEGKISFNNGNIDTQTPGLREVPMIQAKAKHFIVLPHINLFHGVGHGFGNDGLYGPMTEQSIMHILVEIDWLVEP